MTIAFSTKGQTLARLRNRLKSANILPLVLTNGPQSVSHNSELREFLQKHKPLVVRSSSLQEDTQENSMAGHFLSIVGVDEPQSLSGSIQKVLDSYGDSELEDNEVLIQPKLNNAKIVGVMFTKVPANGSDYFVINYDTAGNHDAVTSGKTNELRTFYIARGVKPASSVHQKLVKLGNELMELFRDESLDIEFAIDSDEQLHLFQVRPLSVHSSDSVSSTLIKKAREQIKQQLRVLNQPHPYLYGRQTLFGVMPDWNPAEIIGVRPKPLALTLYKELITDSIWAYQRSNYGYLNLRSFPLLISFHGLPYVDVRVSFNSFIPKDLPSSIAEKLVNYYLQKLSDNPAQHDKVEFNIVLSCYTLDIDDKLEELKKNGFTESECQVLATELRSLTNKIIDPRTGLWINDFYKIDKLKQRQKESFEGISDLQQLIYWQVEDCKRYGTLPFAGLARAAFIAVQMLQSLVSKNVLTESQYNRFMNSLSSVGSEMTEDFARLSKVKFLEKYGHLRPGTYDVESSRYDEAPDVYFNWSKPISQITKTEFKLEESAYQSCSDLLTSHGINHSVDSLMHFIKNAIEGREYAKFVFTKSLSDALQNITRLAGTFGISVEEVAYLNVADLLAETFTAGDIKQTIIDSIRRGKQQHSITRSLNLPPLLSEFHEVDCFEVPLSLPNFITEKKVTAPVIDASDTEVLNGKVVFITNADPGYDWLFSHSIAGLVTQFGGCNSHMAIRANELEIPAVIGAGESLYNRWKRAEVIEIDPANKKVTAVR